MANKEKSRLKDLKNEKQEELFKDLLKSKKHAETHYVELMTQYLQTNDKDEESQIRKKISFSQDKSLYKKFTNEDKKLYISFYTKLYEETDLINSEFRLLESLFEFRLFWKNDITSFKSKTNNRERQLSELIHFLFSEYRLPPFAINVWRHVTRQPHDLAWFFHIAEGKNLRKADFLPFQLTNKYIHHMFSAPSDFTFTQAMVWGVMGSLGIKNKSIKDEICAHNLAKSGRNIDFWTSVFTFINNMAFLEKSQIRPLLDYIHYQKFSLNAPQPNLSMKNRNPATLMMEMENWHTEQRRIQRIQEKDKKKHNVKTIPPTWNPSFELWEKKNHNGKPVNPAWTVQELVSLEELSDEGANLHHCVRSYHSRCALGSVAILSLRRNGKSIATIEVNKKMKEVVQARGFGNRKIDGIERGTLEEWAYQTNIYLSRML